MNSRSAFTSSTIPLLRLINQQILVSKFTTAKEVVGWMGAMQAQDFNMAKWAVGSRFVNSTNKLVESAIDDGQIIRTHLLRPTWHFVSADDLHWMLELTAPHIRASMRSRDKELELTDVVIRKCNSIFENLLQGGKHLSREELAAELERIHITNENNRVYHVLMRAELDGIICSGKIRNNKQTYALFSERVPNTKTLDRDEALSLLALKYFTSHAPATLQDFIWWSGLSVAKAKQALEAVKSNFVSETLDSQIYWFPNAFVHSWPDKDVVHLLPAFDEFLISYKDRKASLPFAERNKAVSTNGIFKPVIVINGQVVGIWRRTIKKDKVILETEPFQPFTIETKKQIAEAALQYENFMNKKVEII